MQPSPFKKLLLIMVLAAAGMAVALLFVNSRTHPQAAPMDVSSSAEPQPDLDDVRPEKITREQAQAWLAKHDRNAMSLLAVFRATGGKNYLSEAAKIFPDDPRVVLAILSRDVFPAERRKWLELFKASSPSNSLANYLSAENYFKEGQPDEAVRELGEAAGKSQFDNCAREIQANSEQLYKDVGKSPAGAATEAMADMTEEDVLELADVRRVAYAIKNLMQDKLAAGEVETVNHLAQTGMMMAEKLNSGDSGKILINKLMGNASEVLVLSALDQNLPCNFLGGLTPAQAVQQIKEEPRPSRELAARFFAAYPEVSGFEMTGYHQRSMIYGKAEAMQWVVEQQTSAGAAK
ncbi:MAG TPA: hypothetical protein VG347_16175 [Verrucomicrobiae bacterium]|nr:hypothetical protein [Verrucomicrobiae bacterium]